MERECIACGAAAGYNRAVVDVLSGGQVGALCVNCEREEFGKSLERGQWAAVENCAFCDRDAFYALPKWLPELHEEDGATVSRVDYEVTEGTLCMCDEHLHEIGVVERAPHATF
jgi:tRNA G26 N,N-dimethylase Trm1